MRKMRGSVGKRNEKASAFYKEAYRAASQIPKGWVATYGDIAKAVGVPGGARAIGMAMANNRDTKTVPCHRVVKGDGEVGGYAGGTKKKIALLRIEGVNVNSSRRKIQDFNRVRFTSFKTEKQ